MAKRGGKTDWFKSKKYGWGWGMPQTWQGWLSFGVFLAVWLVALKVYLLPTNASEISTSNLVTFMVIMLADVLGLLYVSFKYGEAPKWNWGTNSGKRTKAAKSKSHRRTKARSVR